MARLSAGAKLSTGQDKKQMSKTVDYSRHYPIIGKDGQNMLAKAKIMIVGAGALGGYMAYSLSKLGVEKIKIVDRDAVAASDIPRTIFRKEDIGKPKAEMVAQICNCSDIEAIVDDFNQFTANLANGMDMVFDATDNLITRYIINDYCMMKNIPWVHAAIIKTYGFVMPIIPGKTPCFRCYLPNPPVTPLPTCATMGIIAHLPPQVAAIAVSFGMSIILKRTIKRTAIYLDCAAMEFYDIKIRKKEDCKCCSMHEYEFMNMDEKVETFCDGTVQIISPYTLSINLQDFAARLQAMGIDAKIDNKTTAHLEFKDGRYSVALFDNGRMLIHGAKSVLEAKNVYSRYIG